jgi:phospholipid/cholesterol/gamma-HCH transport system substrate-binding protein
MGRNAIETVMGAVVLVVAGGFLAFAYQQSNMKSIDGYSVTAMFTDITGVGPGSDVRVGGLKIGVVESLDLDPHTYQARANLQIKDDVELPEDTSAIVASEGLLGGKFIRLEPGGSDAMLKDGGRIDFTQSSVSLEELIGKFMFSGGGVDGKEEKTEPKVEEPKEEKKNPFSLGF